MKSRRFLNRIVPAFVTRSGVRAGRRAIQRRGRATAKKLMGALFVVEDAEPVEGPLLRGQMRLGRPRRRRLERAMHPLVGAVLLRMGRQDPLSGSRGMRATAWTGCATAVARHIRSG